MKNWYRTVKLVMKMMTPNNFHGLPTDAVLQWALTMAMQLDNQAAQAIRVSDLSAYAMLQAEARVYWQAYNKRFEAVLAEKSKIMLDKH